MNLPPQFAPFALSLYNGRSGILAARFQTRQGCYNTAATRRQNTEAHEPVRAKIRRWYVPNAIYFIVGVTQARRRLFADVANIELLRTIMRNAKELHPFKMQAYALMPDHLHLLIFVPATSNISKIMQSIQWNFTMEYKKLHHITTPTKLWQRGFWDHVIRDGRDYENHFHYIHNNPVKHGYVTRISDYPHTSFHEYVKQGVYDPDWGQVEPDEIRKLDLEPR